MLFLSQIAVIFKEFICCTVVVEVAVAAAVVAAVAAAVAVAVVVDLGFTMLLTSQVIGITFYSEREKSDKFCSGSNFGLRFF